MMERRRGLRENREATSLKESVDLDDGAAAWIA
jgi:hypothetical protein